MSDDLFNESALDDGLGAYEREYLSETYSLEGTLDLRDAREEFYGKLDERLDDESINVVDIELDFGVGYRNRSYHPVILTADAIVFYEEVDQDG